VASLECPRRVARPMVRQSWRDVSFVHWRIEPQRLAPLVPAPLEVDTVDGAAWVTLTPFATTCEMLGTVPLPGPKVFPETNLRTYVRGPGGTDGLWFLSLDVTNRANSVLGRALGLPYHLSDMTITSQESLEYRGHRRRGAADYTVRLHPLGRKRQDALDVFLTGRWSAYVVCGPALWRHDVEHAPWPLHAAELSAYDEDLRAAAGCATPTAPSLVHYATQVSARLSGPRKVQRLNHPAELNSTRKNADR
jgi:uncharacterized protein